MMPLQANIRRLYIFSFLKMTLFPMAIITLYWKEQVGLNLTEIMLLQAFFSGATLLCEYPSGYVGDRYGYRFSLSFASMLGVSGWVIYTLADTFAGLLVAEILLGVSFAFISGSDNALLFESLKMAGRADQYHRFDGRMNAWAQSGEACGAFFAGLLYSSWPLLPFLLQVGVWLAALLICRTLEEPSSPAETDFAASHMQQLRETAVAALGRPGPLRRTILYATVLGLTSFYPVWLIQPWMRDNGVPLAWFGPIWAGANLCVALFSALSHRAGTVFGTRQLCWVFLAAVIVAYSGLGLGSGALIFLYYYLLTAVRGLQGPLVRTALQNAGARSNRASLLSLKSFCFRLVFVATAPLLGILADSAGLATTFLLTGVCLALALLPLTILFLRRESP